MIELHAAGLNKLGYLNGQNARMEEGNPGYSRWCIEDAVVRGWLLKTMEPHLIGLFIHLSSAKEIWDSVTQTFYDGADESYTMQNLTASGKKLINDDQLR